MCGGTSNNGDDNVQLTSECYWFDASRAESNPWIRGEKLPQIRIFHGMLRVNKMDTISNE